MHIVTSKTMAEQTCTLFLDGWIKLVSHRRSFSLGFCVLNFVFSLVATLGNLLVIRALMKNSTIPATVKKLFLSLAFSDLAVGLCSQLMTAIISAVMLKMASSEDDLAFFCPTVLIVLLYFMHLLAVASFLNVTVIAFDRLLAVSLHLRYQEVVTPIRVTIVLVSLWLTSCVSAFLYIFLPKGIAMAAVISVIGFVLTTVAYVRIYKVVRYHQNQIINFSTFSTVPRRHICEVCHPLQLLTHNPLPLRGTIIHDIHLNAVFVYFTKKQGKILILYQILTLIKTQPSV